ncbi:armadillo-type protein [Geopyxis carbonaria]|nr:armadillo-type protein [Geopyxis carbonaria]
MARPSRSAPEETDDRMVLQFNEPLSWKAGKAIPVATLIRRLTALSKELEALDQEKVDRDSLAIAAKDLAAPNLLGHKDDGVKAYASNCLADMLRLHAPDAPYTAQQLKDIFNLFVVCLKGLDDTEAPYYQQYIYLLDSLSTVKSVVLVSDIPDSEQITLALFTSFFDICKPRVSKNVEYHMTDILVQLIEECNSLPTEVVDIIIAQFLRAVPPTVTAPPGKKSIREQHDDTQTKLISAVPPPAYNMAKTICNACTDKMARHICQYFSEVILEAVPSKPRKRNVSDSVDPDGDEEDMGGHEPTFEELHELNKAHTLAKELWKACPPVLQNVIPQLEQEMLAENHELRELATETVGDMALTGNFATSAPATWKAWMGRVNDKHPSVRAKWVELAVQILKVRSDHMAIQLVDLIAVKLNDLDEKVRFAACRSLKELDYESITTKLTADHSPFNTYDSSGSGALNRKSRPNDGDTKNWGKRILLTLAERVRDKKIHVRLEGMRCLAKMWDMAYKDLANGNEMIFEQLGWIPSKILDTFYINDPEVNVLLDHVLHEILIPVNYPPIEKERFADRDDRQANGTAKGKGKSKGKGKGKDKDTVNYEKEREKEVLDGDKVRVQRLLVLVKGLDTKAKRALFAVPLRQISYAKVMEVFLKACEDNNGGVLEEGMDEAAVNTTLEKFSAWLSQKLPEPPRAKENLHRFAKMHDRRCYQLIRYCFSPESEYRTVVRALKEIKKRIGDSTMTTILDSLTPLLYRVSQLIYNKSHVAPIVEFSRTDEMGLGSTAHEVLKEMSASNPAVFKANVKALSDLLQEQSPDANGNTSAPGAVDTLKACAGFAKSYPKDMPQERKLIESLVSFALTGKPPAAAKHAVTIIMYSANRKEMYATDLFKRCVNDFTYGEENFLAKMACLSQLVLLAPEQYEDEEPKVIQIAKDVITNVRTPLGDEEENGPEWCDDDELDEECQAKLLGLRMLVNLWRSHLEGEFSTMVMTVLIRIISSDGEVSVDKKSPKTHRARLRLAAALHLLKLAQQKSCDDLIQPAEFHRLACMAQDPCAQVRHGFVDKLKKYLASNKLPIRFYTIVFLMAFEPVEEYSMNATTWIRARTAALSQRPGNIMENIFARLMSLLVHHPDFANQVKDLSDFAKYILFYLVAVANEENISLIYYVAQRVKQYRDQLSPQNSENLYYISELAQAVIKHYAESRKWTIQTWPGKINLPSSLFAPMRNTHESQEVAGKTYLPAEVESNLKSFINPKGRSAAGTTRKRKNDEKAPSSIPAVRPKKAKSEGKSETPAKKSSKSSKSSKKAKERFETPPPGERRRSGRATAQKVANYREDAASGDEGYDDSDDEMLDAEDSSSESESEDERPKRTPKAASKPKKVTPKSKGKAEKELNVGTEPPKSAEAVDADRSEEKDQEKSPVVTTRTTRAKRGQKAPSPAVSSSELSDLPDLPSGTE